MRPDLLALPPAPLGAPPAGREVRVQWLGTAGFALEHAGTTVLLDPYVTRASLTACLSGPLATDVAAVHRLVPRADAVVVGHTHFDHALDVPTIAHVTGARVFGSRSAAALCRAAGLAEERVVCVEAGPGEAPAVAEVGPFELRFHPSAHSKFMLARTPLLGEIDDGDVLPMRATRYRCGAVLTVEIRVAGRTIVHVGSAELGPRPLDVPGADLVLLCVAGWRASERFPERVVRALAPRAVLLSHWDNFFAPFERARPLPALQLDRLAERLTRASHDAIVGTVPLLASVIV